MAAANNKTHTVKGKENKRERKKHTTYNSEHKRKEKKSIKHTTGWSKKKRGHSTFSQISRKLLKISK